MKKIFILGLLLVFCKITFAQHVITGKVIFSDDKLGVVGATIRIKGTTIGAQTDVNGGFKLKVPDELATKNMNVILSISFVGYTTTEVNVAPEQYLTDRALNISLDASSSGSVGEVVVIGYGTPTKVEDRVPSFPWPPPEFSVLTVLDKAYFKQAKTLSDVNQIIRKALASLKYEDNSYFYIPGGFALVTRIEQIHEDGQSLDSPYRWSPTIRAYNHLSWVSYIKALVFPPNGYFRIIVFTVTDKPFSSSGKKISKKAAERWLHEGLNILPNSIGEKKFGKDYYCTALIYEFKKVESADAQLLIPGNLTGWEHLVKSGISLLLVRH